MKTNINMLNIFNSKSSTTHKMHECRHVQRNNFYFGDHFKYTQKWDTASQKQIQNVKSYFSSDMGVSWS